MNFPAPLETNLQREYRKETEKLALLAVRVEIEKAELAAKEQVTKKLSAKQTLFHKRSSSQPSINKLSSDIDAMYKTLSLISKARTKTEDVARDSLSASLRNSIPQDVIVAKQDEVAKTKVVLQVQNSELQILQATKLLDMKSGMINQLEQRLKEQNNQYAAMMRDLSRLTALYKEQEKAWNEIWG